MNHDGPPDSPFDRIVDDQTSRTQCTDWAIGEIAGGRTPEDVAAALIANGWPKDDAEEICEIARRQTRSARGAVSRQDVASAFGADDPNIIGNATPFARPGLFGALGGLLRAITRFRATRKIGKRRL